MGTICEGELVIEFLLGDKIICHVVLSLVRPKMNLFLFIYKF